MTVPVTQLLLLFVARDSIMNIRDCREPQWLKILSFTCKCRTWAHALCWQTSTLLKFLKQDTELLPALGLLPLTLTSEPTVEGCDGMWKSHFLMVCFLLCGLMIRNNYCLWKLTKVKTWYLGAVFSLKTYLSCCRHDKDGQDKGRSLGLFYVCPPLWPRAQIITKWTSTKFEKPIFKAWYMLVTIHQLWLNFTFYHLCKC